MNLALDKTTWTRFAFGDVIDSITDRVDNPAEAGVDRYVGLEHLDPGVLTVQRWASPDSVEAQKLRFQPGDVIFGRRRAYQKKVAMAEFEGICSAHALVLRAKPKFLYPPFLPFFLASDYFLDRAISISVGSLSPTVNWRDLKVEKFDLPSLPEQQSIADLLWAVEHARTVIKYSSRQLRNAADAFFSKALLLMQVESIPIPELFEEITVGVVVKPTQYYTDNVYSGVPALRGLNVLPGAFDLSSLVRFRPESAKILRKSTLKTGDIVVVRTGRPGDAAVITPEIDGFNCIDLIILRPGQDIDADFFALYLNSEVGRSQIAKRSAGTAQVHFNVGALKELVIPQLSVIEQQSIVATIHRIRDAVRAFEYELDHVRQLQASLMHECFGGAA